MKTATRLAASTLASGAGWLVREVACSAGPHDHPFEEQHETVTVAAVVSGTFRYRTTQGAALLVPGAVLLGNHERCFECSHEHGSGDRCLSMHLTPEFWETLAGAVPRVRRSTFARPSIPATQGLTAAFAALQTARGASDTAWEETALEFAATVLRVESGLGRATLTTSARDERRIADAVRRIEASAHGSPSDLTLANLARDAALSSYHFLRIFRDRVGMTPHQYVLRTRLLHAAVELCESDKPVAAIAFDAGFNDLSTFNRRFKRLLRASPSDYRRAHVHARSNVL